MTPADRDAYSKYRLEKAWEAYSAAEVLIANQQWNAAVNRLYYAIYYSVSGVLAKKGIDSKTHAGTKTQFLLHFIKPGTIDIRFGKLYADLFDWRQRGDYGDFFDFNQEDVLPILQPTREMLEVIATEAK